MNSHEPTKGSAQLVPSIASCRPLLPNGARRRLSPQGLAARGALHPWNGDIEDKVTSRADAVFQIKVTLRGIRPLIWRRLQVPATYSFWDLHVAIQDAMGWRDCHLHEFRVQPAPRRHSLRIGIPDDDAFEGDRPILPGWDVPIAKYLDARRNLASYVYDFGDDWRHRLVLERVVPRLPGNRYPVCIAGERKCPPEDVGGVPGYEEFLRAIADPDHEEHDSYLSWVGGSYDPDAFDPQSVRFWDPEKRWRIAFLDEDEDEP